MMGSDCLRRTIIAFRDVLVKVLIHFSSMSLSNIIGSTTINETIIVVI